MRLQRANGTRGVKEWMGKRTHRSFAPFVLLASSPLLVAQRKADTAHRVDQARQVGTFDFTPQVADIDVEHIGVYLRRLAPDPVEDRLARQDAASVAR